jgi:hypothetical protein
MAKGKTVENVLKATSALIAGILSILKFIDCIGKMGEITEET